jgi:sigma-B regulation protein RsbU (phosphoserine phosphatase)
MAQLGVSRIFLLDSENRLFKKRGFQATDKEAEKFAGAIKKLNHQWFSMEIDELPEEHKDIHSFLVAKKIRYLVNIAETKNRRAVLGLGEKVNRQELKTENIEYAFFVSKFSLGAIENAILVNRLIETKRMEHELQIARDIQLSLLPQSVPELDNFEVSVVYDPINEVGGDYYDILKERNGSLPILIADVEGKGLSAALLAASSQAIFRSLNELYLSEPGKFISKANAMIYDFTKGNRFITIFWVLLHGVSRKVTYVNAGHVEPLIISPSKGAVTPLSKGGFLTGFIEEADYESETLELDSGDIILAFTDGVPEVENSSGEEFGLDAMIAYIKENHTHTAKELTDGLVKATKAFSKGTKYRDDFTLMIIKVK